jgi:hypothetical protein
MAFRVSQGAKAPSYALVCLERVGGGIWRIILRCDALDPVVIPICGIF